jgi:hypothetical protein
MSLVDDTEGGGRVRQAGLGGGAGEAPRPQGVQASAAPAGAGGHGDRQRVGRAVRAGADDWHRHVSPAWHGGGATKSAHQGGSRFDKKKMKYSELHTNLGTHQETGVKAGSFLKQDLTRISFLVCSSCRKNAKFFFSFSEVEVGGLWPSLQLSYTVTVNRDSL